MDVSRTEAIDAIDDLLSDLQGASEALSLFGAAELPITFFSVWCSAVHRCAVPRRVGARLRAESVQAGRMAAPAPAGRYLSARLADVAHALAHRLVSLDVDDV